MFTLRLLDSLNLKCPHRPMCLSAGSPAYSNAFKDWETWPIMKTLLTQVDLDSGATLSILYSDLSKCETILLFGLTAQIDVPNTVLFIKQEPRQVSFTLFFYFLEKILYHSFEKMESVECLNS